MAATGTEDVGVEDRLEQADNDETIESVVARHLTDENAVVVQAGGGTEAILDKDHINFLKGSYRIVDPSRLGGRYGNIEWTGERSHFVNPGDFGEEPLYVTQDIPSVIERVREFEHGNTYQEELRQGMQDWTRYVSSLETPYVLSFEVDFEAVGYFESGRLSERAYTDLVTGLDADVEPDEDGRAMITSYSSK